MKHLLLLIFSLTILLLSSSCSSKIYPDRSQFIKDGDPIPTVDLSNYKSVQNRPGQDSSLAIAMAISGGGLRASNYGVGIMLGLEQILLGDSTNALREVDYLSTVSGGGFAAGAYINALYTHQDEGRIAPFSLKSYLNRTVRPSLTKSYMNVLVGANFNPRLWFSKNNDGDALERAVDNYVLGYKARNEGKSSKEGRSILLRDVFVPADSIDSPVRFPMAITNSSVINTMTIFPFTPDILSRYKVSGFRHRYKYYENPNFDPFDMPLSVGIKTSGSFPVLISDSSFPSLYSDNRPYLHLMDGAMTDNNGYVTALEVLRQDKANRKVLFLVDADASGNIFTYSEKEGAYAALYVYGQLAGSGLYARRALMEKDIKDAGKQYNIIPVFLGFNILIRDNEAEPPIAIKMEEEMARLTQLMQTNMDALTDVDLQILYELVINVGTKYSMTQEEQDLMMLAGQKIVKIQEAKIRAALGY